MLLENYLSTKNANRLWYEVCTWGLRMDNISQVSKFHTISPQIIQSGYGTKVGGGKWVICSEPASFSQWLSDFVSVSVTCFSVSLSLGVISFLLIFSLVPPYFQKKHPYPLITNHQIGQLGFCLYSKHHFLPKLITPSFKGLPSQGSLSSMKSHICIDITTPKVVFPFFLVAVVQLLSNVWLFVTPWTAALQASLSFTITRVC